jgi:hypothetical protein
VKGESKKFKSGPKTDPRTHTKFQSVYAPSMFRVSVVYPFLKINHHRDTEAAEAAEGFTEKSDIETPPFQTDKLSNMGNTRFLAWRQRIGANGRPATYTSCCDSILTTTL